MISEAIITYCISDEICKSSRLVDDPQCKMSTAEVMTFAVLSASLFGGDYHRASLIMKYNRLFPKILSLSQLVRRIHKIPDEVWMQLFIALRLFLKNEKTSCFIVDSFPVKAYENHKSYRARIFANKKFHGYTASKKQYFFGIKVHMIVDIDGVPIEFLLTPGSVADISAFKQMVLDLPTGSTVLGDKAYTSYQFEDELAEIEGIRVIAKRKDNAKRQHPKSDEILLSLKRNRIETTFSSITSRMPRAIRARTERGFCLKICFFILAYMVNLCCPVV